ncbi:MAG: thermonuclease family protein [Fimbriimonadaceae bacterium]
MCASLYAVDGDTIKCNGQKMRDMGDGQPFVSGYDTPEIWSRECTAELELARKAKKRMGQLLKAPGTQIYDSGKWDDMPDSRPLVWVVLATGETVGHRLIAEGLARPWTPDYVADWCS